MSKYFRESVYLITLTHSSERHVIRTHVHRNRNAPRLYDVKDDFKSFYISSVNHLRRLCTCSTTRRTLSVSNCVTTFLAMHSFPLSVISVKSRG